MSKELEKTTLRSKMEGRLVELVVGIIIGVALTAITFFYDTRSALAAGSREDELQKQQIEQVQEQATRATHELKQLHKEDIQKIDKKLDLIYQEILKLNRNAK